MLSVKISVDDRDTMAQLAALSPRKFMIMWTTHIKQFAQSKARTNIGGNFGDQIARHSILTDTGNENLHEIYAGGENGYIAEHIHTGGIIKPKYRRYLAIPIDASVKGKYPREYSGELVVIRRKEDGTNGRAYLAKVMKRKVKPLWLLAREVHQKPRPWWPDDAEVHLETIRFFREEFGGR